jgi:TRAP-type C4-dicarboxylate transport system permease small subunit
MPPWACGSRRLAFDQAAASTLNRADAAATPTKKNAMNEPIHRFCDAAYQICIWVSGLSVLLMTLIIPWGIFTRYVLGTGSQWPEPIAITLMVLFTFMGAAAAYRAGAHIAVEMVTMRLPVVLRAASVWFVHLTMLAVALFMTYHGTTLCIKTWNQVIGQLPWMPVGLTYTPVPIGGLFTALFVLEHMLFGSQAQRPIVTFDHIVEDGGTA